MKALKIFALSILIPLSFSTAYALQVEPEFSGIETYEVQVNAAEQIQPLDTIRLRFNFGRVWVNTTNSVRYFITNTGDIPLHFRSATISGSSFGAYHSCQGTLQPRERCWFVVQYRPFFEGFHSGRFVLSFHENIRVIVDVMGSAHR